MSEYPTRDVLRARNYRAYHGVSLCRNCVECETMFHVTKGLQRRCRPCQDALNEVRYLQFQNTRELISLGLSNPKALEALRQEIVDDEGELIAESICGKACEIVEDIVERRGFK